MITVLIKINVYVLCNKTYFVVPTVLSSTIPNVIKIIEIKPIILSVSLKITTDKIVLNTKPKPAQVA